MDGAHSIFENIQEMFVGMSSLHLRCIRSGKDYTYYCTVFHEVSTWFSVPFSAMITEMEHNKISEGESMELSLGLQMMGTRGWVTWE